MNSGIPQGPPQFPSSNSIHSNSTNFFTWLATHSLNIPTGYKGAIFFKEQVFISMPFIEIVYDVDTENSPYFLGYIFGNERNELMTNIYSVYWSIYEVDDHKNSNRSTHVYSDYCFRKLRRFRDSSIIDMPEAVQTIVNAFHNWPYTKEMWMKIEALKPKNTFYFSQGP